MSKNYERDEREEYWRRPQQNRESQERWSGSGWEDDYGNDQPYGRDFGRDWDERTGGMSRENFGGRGGMMGMRSRESQWEGGWNQGMGRGQGHHDRGMEGSYTGRGPRSYKRSD